MTLGELARSLHEQSSVEDTLHGIVTAALGTVPGAEYAALSVIEARRAVPTRAGTADVVYKVDQVQYDTGEGLCLDALYQQHTVRLSDMAAETRWPRFTDRVAELGIGSMLSFQLYVEQDNLGALNLYAQHSDAFSDESEQVGLLFATHAAVAMADAQQHQQLTRAIAGTRPDRAGEGHLDGAPQTHRRTGVHPAGPGQPENRHQSHRCRQLPFRDRRTRPPLAAHARAGPPTAAWVIRPAAWSRPRRPIPCASGFGGRRHPRSWPAPVPAPAERPA